MLGLGGDDPNKKKKRKSSSIDFTMWNDIQGSARSLGSGSSLAGTTQATLTRNRALLLIVLVMAVMFFSISSTSLMRSSSQSNNLRPATNSNAVMVRNNGDNKVMTFQDPVPVGTARHYVRHGDPVASTAPPRPNSFAIVVVADLDKQSKDATSKKPTFYSFLQHGTLKITRRAGSDLDDYSVSWGETQKFTTTMNEAGRGFELSELAWFNGKLLAFDDRTGIVYQLQHFEMGNTKPLRAVPQHIVMEGDGAAGKGQKHEWATVKDGKLYMGSVGKEFTDNAGTVLGDSNLWVAVMDEHGDVHHEDWSSNFAHVRKALGCEYPGYVIHEAIEWSSVHRKWFILPRRVSQEAYNDELDEKRGSNKVVIASEDFSSIEVLSVGKITPLRGFSSFKFVPRTGDSVIVAIKSVEVEADQTQTSFLTVFDIQGNVLLDETELPGGHKYEGVAFAHDWSS
jgi:soluble calcium-activated nucleotidase 1